MYKVEPIIIKRQNPEQLDYVDNFNFNYITHKVYTAGKSESTPKMSICVLGYKNIEKTKRCVESVLKYIGEIDYEFILLDNGSDDNDETYNYFQTVPTYRKKIIKVEEALGVYYGSVYGTELVYKYSSGDYLTFLGNDNIITENSLQNIERCLDSDVNIGLAVPMSSNVWMLQNPGLEYSNFEEMFEKAKKFNEYDPKKWQDRMTLTTVATTVKREAIDRIGFYDAFAEASLCFRMRQAGYKTLLLGDTWVCHDHDYDEKIDSQPWIGTDDKSAYIRNRNDAIAKKYFGFGTFEDIIVPETGLTNMININESKNSIPELLALDVRCGQGMLDLKNRLRTFGIFETNSVAFTTDAKYYKWLETVSEQVFCDRIDYIDEVLEGFSFDYIIIGKAINLYHEPIKLVRKLLLFLKEDGQLIFKLRNSSDLRTLIKALGLNKNLHKDLPIHISIDDMINCIKYMGYENITMQRDTYTIGEKEVEVLAKAFLATSLDNASADCSVRNILTENYNLCVKNCRLNR